MSPEPLGNSRHRGKELLGFSHFSRHRSKFAPSLHSWDGAFAPRPEHQESKSQLMELGIWHIQGNFLGTSQAQFQVFPWDQTRIKSHPRSPHPDSHSSFHDIHGLGIIWKNWIWLINFWDLSHPNTWNLWEKKRRKI